MCFLYKEGMPTMELLAPHDSTSPVQQTLDKMGVTPYHTYYEVEDLDGCYISKTHDAEELAKLLDKALVFGKTTGHKHIIDMHLDNVHVTKRIIANYNTILKQKKNIR